MAPASKRPLTPKKRVLPIKCTCEGLYNMIFYNYKKEQTDTHLIHVIMREGKTYKSLRDIVDILNETLEMNLTVRTLTQGTGHYVLQKDRVTANLPCQNTASGYKGTVFVNDIGVHDTLVKYLNASNSTIQNRNNATMDNIKKVRINANTLVQMLVKQDSLFQMREGVDPKSIPTEHDIKIGRRSRSTANKNNGSSSTTQSSIAQNNNNNNAPKVASRGNGGDSDLSPLSCLAMLASQANQLPTEDGTNIRKKIISMQNSGQMVPPPDVRNSEYNTPNSAKPNPIFSQHSQQPSPFPGSNNMNNRNNGNNNYNNNNNNNNHGSPVQYHPLKPYPQNNNNNNNNNMYEMKNPTSISNIVNDNSKNSMNGSMQHMNNNNNNNNNNGNNNNNNMSNMNMNNINNHPGNMFQNSMNHNKERRYSDFRNGDNLYSNNNNQYNQNQNSDNMMVDDVIPNPSFRSKNRNNNDNEQQQSEHKGADERKRQRADSENDAFRKSFKTESDEYVANPRINHDYNMSEMKYQNENSATVTKYMDLEPRPMSAPANLERSSINESDSENSVEFDEKIKINLSKKAAGIEKSLSQSNSPILKNSKGNGKGNKKKNKSKLMDNKKKNSIKRNNKDIEKDLANENDIFDKTTGESIKNC